MFDMAREPLGAAGFVGDDGATDAAIIKLADFFTDCQAITFLQHIAIIEFPNTDSKAFRARIATLTSQLPRIASSAPRIETPSKYKKVKTTKT